MVRLSFLLVFVLETYLQHQLVVSESTLSVCLRECPIGYEATGKCEEATGFRCKKCPSGHFNDKNGGRCRPCNSCRPGEYVSLHCDAENAAICFPCDSYSYAERENTERCQPCSVCPQHTDVAENCTRAADTVCGGCSEGYFFHVQQHICLPCSYCYDGEKTVNIEIEECRTKASNPKKICMPAAFPPAVRPPQDEQSLDSDRKFPKTIVTSRPIGNNEKVSMQFLFSLIAIISVFVILMVVVIWILKRKNLSKFWDTNKAISINKQTDFIQKEDKPFQVQNRTSASLSLYPSLCESNTTMSTRISEFSDRSITDHCSTPVANDPTATVESKPSAKTESFDPCGEVYLKANQNTFIVDDDSLKNNTQTSNANSTLVFERLLSTSAGCSPLSIKKETAYTFETDLIAQNSCKDSKPIDNVKCTLDSLSVVKDASGTVLECSPAAEVLEGEPSRAIVAIHDNRIEYEGDCPVKFRDKNQANTEKTIEKDRLFRSFRKPKIPPRKRSYIREGKFASISQMTVCEKDTASYDDQKRVSSRKRRGLRRSSSESESIEVPMNRSLIDMNVV